MTKPLSRIYAIGDIHGRADLLTLLHKTIAADAKGFDGTITLLYLGDYIDRGPQSRQVLDILTGDSPVPGAERVFLMGNHEYAFIDFCEDPKRRTDWLHRWGGAATLQSYGVPYSPGRKAEDLAAALLHALPDTHAAFLDELVLYDLRDNLLFVHAGVRPGVELDEQAEHDLLFIKDDFTKAPEHGLPYTVVFGHSIQEHPLHLPDRIGVDTGAYMGGPLTAAVFEGENVKFLQVRLN